MKSFGLGVDVDQQFAAMWRYGWGLGLAVCGDRGSYLACWAQLHYRLQSSDVLPPKQIIVSSFTMSYPSLNERLISLATNAAAAYVIFVVASGQLLPTGGLESVWLVCAASYWFLNLLSAPWFIPPRDAIISAVGAILVLTTMDLSSVSTFARELNHVRWGAVVFSGVVIVFAVAAVAFHERDNRSPFGHLAYQISNIFGRGETLFSAPAVVSIIAH